MNRNRGFKGFSRGVLAILIAALLICGGVTGILAFATEDEEAAELIGTAEVVIDTEEETVDETAPADEEAPVEEEAPAEEKAPAEVVREAVSGSDADPVSEEDELLALGEEPYEAAIGDTNYETLTEAIAAAEGGATVTLLKDITYTGNTGWAISNKSVVFDLNGHNISATATEMKGAYIFTITGGGVLTVKDSAGGGKMSMHWTNPDPSFGAGSYVCYTNGGSLIVNGGTLYNDSKGASYAITNWSGTTTINGGSLITTSGSAVRIFCNGGTDKLVVNGGTISGGYMGVQVQDNGTKSAEVVINGGTITSTGSDYCVYATGPNTSFTINGGDFKTSVYVSETVPVENCAVNDGLFEGKYGFYYFGEDPYPVVHGGIFTGTYGDYYAYVNKADDAEWVYLPDGSMYVGKFEYVEVTVTPDALRKYYSADDPELTYTLSTAAADEFITVTLEREEGEDIGTYEISAKELAGGFNDDKTVYYDPVLSDTPVVFSIVGPYAKRTLNGQNGTVVNGDEIYFSAKLVSTAVSSEDKTKLEAQTPEGKKLAFSQEVHFELAGSEAPFKGTIDVTLQPGTKYNGETVTVIHIKGDGSIEKWDRKVESGKVTVTVDSLSPFGVYPPAGSGASPTPGGGGSNDGTPKTGDTGLPLYIPIAALLCSIAVMAFILARSGIRSVFPFLSARAAAGVSASVTEEVVSGSAESVATGETDETDEADELDDLDDLDDPDDLEDIAEGSAE